METQIKKAKAALKGFFKAWKELEHQAMYDNCNFTWSRNKTVETVKAMFPEKIEAYRVKSWQKVTPMNFDAIVVITMRGNEATIRVRLLCEEGAYMPSEKGTFGINPSSIRKI